MDLVSLPDDVLYQIASAGGAQIAAQLGQSCKQLNDALLKADNQRAQRWWQARSVDRWGSRVTKEEDPQSSSSASDPVNWRAYYAFRSSWWSAPKPSPLELVQERFCDDPWRLLACCLLASRTSGGSTVQTVIDTFLAKYPTPSSVLDEKVEVLAELLHPLGLHREIPLCRAALGFLSPAWTGGQARDLYGCGPFANDSWLVFTVGGPHVARVAKDPSADRNVRSYAAWALRHMEEAQLQRPPVTATAALETTGSSESSPSAPGSAKSRKGRKSAVVRSPAAASFTGSKRERPAATEISSSSRKGSKRKKL